MFTSGNLNVEWNTKRRYLIKHQGVWKILKTWAICPDWDDDVTDAIWLKNEDMVASWWLMKNGRRYIRRKQPMITDEELAFLLLQVEV